MCLETLIYSLGSLLRTRRLVCCPSLGCWPTIRHSTPHCEAQQNYITALSSHMVYTIHSTTQGSTCIHIVMGCILSHCLYEHGYSTTSYTTGKEVGTKYWIYVLAMLPSVPPLERKLVIHDIYLRHGSKPKALKVLNINPKVTNCHNKFLTFFMLKHVSGISSQGRVHIKSELRIHRAQGYNKL